MSKAIIRVDALCEKQDSDLWKLAEKWRLDDPRADPACDIVQRLRDALTLVISSKCGWPSLFLSPQNGQNYFGAFFACGDGHHYFCVRCYGEGTVVSLAPRKPDPSVECIQQGELHVYASTYGCTGSGVLPVVAGPHWLMIRDAVPLIEAAVNEMVETQRMQLEEAKHREDREFQNKFLDWHRGGETTSDLMPLNK